MIFIACVDDTAFGPGVSGCRGGFDFTVKFEQLFFSILPSALFVALSLWRVAVSVRRPVVARSRLLQYAKLAATVTFAALDLALLCLVTARSTDNSELAIAAVVLPFLAAVCMIPLSFVDHGRSARPSVLLNVYLLITLLLDIAQTRTYWLASATELDLTYTRVFTASIALKVAILVLEAQRKCVESSKGLTVSPEETSGIYSLGVYFWLNRLFLSGYRKSLQLEELHPLERDMAGNRLYERYEKHADYTKLRGTKFGLGKLLIRALLPQILMVIPPRLCWAAFQFCQPFLIDSVLSQLSSPVTGASSNIAWGLIGATALIYAGIAVSIALYWYFQFRVLMMTRAILVTAIYEKATKAEIGAEDSTESITLMSVDIERLMLGFENFHEIWAANIQVSLASWLLYNELGVAFIAPIVVTLICFLALSFITRFTGDSQRSWMAGVQKRVGLTSTVIANMKNMKIAALVAPVSDLVQRLRVDELGAGARFRRLILVSTILALGPLMISPFMTFAFSQRSLDTATLFTSLSYLILLATPLLQAMRAIPQVLSGMACLGRIQAFLECKSRHDFRSVLSSVKETMEKEPLSETDIETDLDQSDAAIVVSHGSFSWEEDKTVLHDINIRIPKSCLTIVVGPVASGKSTLCQALLGEIPISQGNVLMRTRIGRVAYCDQSPFLFNSSIKDNIIGHLPLNEERYAEVVNATMLSTDFEIFARGDRTQIGSNGLTLSGGQRQRVSLARALYLHSDLLILDDVFSGLDADTEEQVFSRVFGQGGVIQRRRATAVLCTHSVRHLPSAKHIVALSSEGTVLEQGTFAELMANDNYVRNLGVKASASDIQSDSISQIVSRTGREDSKPGLLTRATTASLAPEQDSTAQRLGDWQVYKIYFKSMGALVPAAFFGSAALLGFFYNFPTVWFRYWSEDVFGDHPTHSYGYYLGLYSFFQIACLLSFAGLGQFIWVVAIRKSGANLHHDILRTLIRAPLRFLTTTDQGVITNLFSQDLNLVDTQLPNALLNFLFNFSIALGQAAVMVTSSPYIAISYPFLIALMWVIQKFYLRTSRQLRILDLEAKSPLYTHFLDTIKGIVTLRAFGSVPDHRADNLQLLDTSQRPWYLLLMAQQWLTLVLNFIVMGIAVLLVALALKLRSNAGFTGASLITLMSFGENLSGIVMYWTKLETSIGAIGRLRTFNDTVKPEARAEEDIIPPEKWPEQGRIELKGVSASYGVTKADNSPELALRNVDLAFAPGEKVAICGRTGSGKSSVIAFLLKLLDPIEGAAGGQASIDGTPLHRVDRPALRQRLIAMPQDAVFLPEGSTFRQNLNPLAVAAANDDGECRAVLETVDMWAVVQERGGLDAPMNPYNLSQGQRQLFSLAYAVMRRRIRAGMCRRDGGGGDGDGGAGAAIEGGVLLLDEVSSSVDQETEQVMLNVIRTEFRSYTVLTVSHRLGMIMDFDTVVVMDKGAVAEVGNPRVLAARADTRFGELWRAGGQ
ncbi:P-loop containing nucleoside triphosphate hydrolase protein [Xylariomycetidae sp. FL2044]|nr:P-loop containing nucleoside triphosphate hydrolase protein [Xylariomycetidae sp. FL2044]